MSNIFAPFIKNLESYFVMLICFEFWPLWIGKAFVLLLHFQDELDFIMTLEENSNKDFVVWSGAVHI